VWFYVLHDGVVEVKAERFVCGLVIVGCSSTAIPAFRRADNLLQQGEVGASLYLSGRQLVRHV
jgi:hypothetical protein